MEIKPVEVRGIKAALIGNPAVLEAPLLGLFCSQICPGELVLKAYDTAKALREQGTGVISGFHAPIEKDLLAILVRGTAPVVLCAARRLESWRLPGEYREWIGAGRLAIAAPDFGANEKRITLATAARRNELILRVCSTVLAVYARPGGQVEQICRRALAGGKPVFAVESGRNAHLFEIGAQVWGGAEKEGIILHQNGGINR